MKVSIEVGYENLKDMLGEARREAREKHAFKGTNIGNISSEIFSGLIVVLGFL